MIHDIILADPLEPVTPPETVLRIAAVEDSLFISIEKYVEDGKSTTCTTIASQAVSLPALREALDLMRHDVDRENLRPPQGPNGGRDARIGGARFGVTPL